MRRFSDTKSLRSSGERLGRDGLSERVIELVCEFHLDPTYKGAIALAGRLHAISLACGYDDYWSEKAAIGFHREMRDLENLAARRASLREGG